MAAPLGNKHAAKDRYVRKALLDVAAEFSPDPTKPELAFQSVARVVWNFALGGERWAIEFLRDTMDGKPKQQMDVDYQGPPILTGMTVTLVKPEDAR